MPDTSLSLTEIAQCREALDRRQRSTKIWVYRDDFDKLARAHFLAALELAERYLKMTEPVTPAPNYPGLEGEFGDCLCGKTVTRYWNRQGKPAGERDKYCPNCGRPLKWV